MAIELRGASYRYAGAPNAALTDITLRVEPGTVLGIAGANDAGKSTLCLVASGLAPAVIGGHLTGDVTIDGAPTSGLKPYALAQRCGILFQNAVTQLSGTARTVWEEIAFGPRNLGLAVDEVAARVEDALARLAITGLAERDPGRLSGGQAQLVALASVLALRPSYLVLDEPTSQLDPQGTRLVGDALAAFALDAGTGVLLVEHKADLLARLAARVAILDGGRIAREGPTAEVLGDPGLGVLGVEPPAPVALARAGAAAKVHLDPAALAVDR
jgi:energy-coupling factor transporter ATP-binding protein EcfA2